MTDAWLAGASFLLALALSLIVERVAASGRAPPLVASAIPARALLIGALFLFWLGLFRRPVLAGFATAVTVAVVSAVSVRKRQLVAEPLVFSDFALLRLVVRHPELYYVGFMADPRFIASAVAFLAGLSAWIWLEPPALAPLPGLALSAAVLVAIAALWALAPRRPLASLIRQAAPRPDLEVHVGRWGLLLTLAAYALRWRAEIGRSTPTVEARFGSTELRPDLVVVVQLESFMDPVRAGLSDTALPGLDRAREQATLHGPLDVPSHGAFTMRSEYAVLTGLDPAESGFRQFDPYLSSRGPVPPTLATRLRAQGFRTLFIHPFRAGFFNREAVMPRLGFDACLWDEDFAGAERIGPYVSDTAFAERVLAEARTGSGRPLFIMAVSMENHGPWPPDRLPDEPDATRQYLRHLAGSDRAVSTLLDGFAQHPGRVLLCLFGDHPPILPGIDRDRPPQTDYAVLEIGQSARRAAPTAATLSVGELGRVLLRMASGDVPVADPSDPPRAA